LLCLILVKIEFHSHPLSVGSHAKKGTVYPTIVSDSKEWNETLGSNKPFLF
jgi:hypothetical protein